MLPWKTVLKAVGWGLLAALGGFFAAGWGGALINGLPYESAALLSMGAYLCFLVALCAGLVLARLKK